MISSCTVGTTGKFISATHIGIRSKPSFGGSGAKGIPAESPSTAIASLPCRSMIEVKSYFIEMLLSHRTAVFLSHSGLKKAKGSVRNEILSVRRKGIQHYAIFQTYTAVLDALCL